MEKDTITIDNYQQTMSDKNIRDLPDFLQKGHRFFREAHLYYDTDPVIKETIDMYLKRLNGHVSKGKGLSGTKTSGALPFIREFLLMHNTIKYRKNIRVYIDALQKAITDKKIKKDDVNAHHIKKIQEKLIHLHNDKLGMNKATKIIINEKWRLQLQQCLQSSNVNDLGGIKPLIETEVKQAIQKPVSNPLFTAMDIPPRDTNRKTFRLPGGFGELLGDIERFELAITIEGDQGGGKTRFTYQLADSFASLGNRIAIFSLEIGSRSDLISRMKGEYLQEQNQRNIFIADQLPDGYNTIASAAGTFDVIIIDSWNKTGLPSQNFDKLRKENPNTIFIVIFQRTTQRTIRGGTAPLFDAGINIEVVKADDTFKNNYAVTTKNRYGITGIKYNIFSKEIINGEAAASEVF